MHVVVATTLAAFVTDDPDTSEAWLYTAEAMTRAAREVDVDLRFFAALETDARGIEPFKPLLNRLDYLETRLGVTAETFTFDIDDGREAVTTANRLRHITFGQNLCTDYALSCGADGMLFLASDLTPHPDTIPRFLELNHPLVGGQVDTYGLDGPIVPKYIPRFGTAVREHMATAAYVYIRRDLLRFVRWRWDLDAGMSDDPCLHYDAETFHGVPTYVRHDVRGQHFPECIGPIETRHDDMKVYR